MARVEMVDGLYTERAGEGPALVLVPGGGGDAGVYEDVVPLLASRYTVITMDRRGNSRSAATTVFSVAEQADDIVAVLDHHGFRRGYVFGSSGSAIIALELLVRHPDRLLGLVAHEPPLMQLLPDGPERREFDRLGRIARTKGPLRGFVTLATMTMPTAPRVFGTSFGRTAIAAALWAALALGRLGRAVTRRPAGGMTRLIGNARTTLLVELPGSIESYQPDIDGLRGATTPWCLAAGRDSARRSYHRPAVVLGELLGKPLVEFPGGHVPYQQYPAEFCECLTTILDSFAVVGERE